MVRFGWCAWKRSRGSSSPPSKVIPPAVLGANLFELYFRLKEVGDLPFWDICFFADRLLSDSEVPTYCLVSSFPKVSISFFGECVAIFACLLIILTE